MGCVRQAKLPEPPAGTSTDRGLQDPREVVVEMLPHPDNILVKEQKEFKELTAEDMVKANEWLRQQGGRRYRYLY